MRKSLQSCQHTIKDIRYSNPLPGELKPYHVYLADCGHSILCVLKTHLVSATGQMDEYEVPVPVKYVMERGYHMKDGYVIVEAEYDETLGLVVDDEYYEW